MDFLREVRTHRKAAAKAIIYTKNVSDDYQMAEIKIRLLITRHCSVKSGFFGGILLDITGSSFFQEKEKGRASLFDLSQ